MSDERLQELSDKIDLGQATEQEELEFLDLYKKFLNQTKDHIEIEKIKNDLLQA
jgi:hypothetical protein